MFGLIGLVWLVWFGWFGLGRFTAFGLLLILVEVDCGGDSPPLFTYPGSKPKPTKNPLKTH